MYPPFFVVFLEHVLMRGFIEISETFIIEV